MSDTRSDYQRGYDDAMKFAAILPCPRCELRYAEQMALHYCTCSSVIDSTGARFTECEPHKRLRELRAEQETTTPQRGQEE